MMQKTPDDTLAICAALRAAGAAVALYPIADVSVVAILGSQNEPSVRKQTSCWRDVNIFLRLYGRRMFPEATIP